MPRPRANPLLHLAREGQVEVDGYLGGREDGFGVVRLNKMLFKPYVWRDPDRRLWRIPQDLLDLMAAEKEEAAQWQMLQTRTPHP